MKHYGTNGSKFLRPIQIFGRDESVREVVFTPHSAHILTVGKRVRLYSIETGQMVAQAKQKIEGRAHQVTFSSEGKHFVTADDAFIRHWKLP